MEKRKGIQSLVVWVIGNLLWEGFTYVYSKAGGDARVVTAITMIGFLVLLVLGLSWFMWSLYGSRQNVANTAQLEMMARFLAASYFAQKYGIDPDELKDADNPQAMEERAKRIKAERELNALKNQQRA